MNRYFAQLSKAFSSQDIHAKNSVIELQNQNEDD